ncbi:acetyl-CoA synthetase-like protein [Cylindrobasidium torrendii FP15055 ss-10]|uniref:Acetyl-CoA synthetase-like protein n=1 Tax=Cylindrobasidium torrendii FP15055 ss-10 TaxID=1314674 RepID=A0A0D7BAV5_9AGAR|nr:acetyl-CoA synthetase-like protein [Cylindrobasidium torrendii FP15055 ss-10]
MAATWKPAMSIAQADKLLTAPGSPLQTETRFINGRVQQVFKNLPPTLRALWIGFATQWADRTCIVYEDQRYTFGKMLQLSAAYASIFEDAYGVRKGDRVVICSRNYPSYVTALWACHLLGAVPVLVNAWLPIVPLAHCLKLTAPKVIILDCERADIVEPIVSEFAPSATFFVLESHESTRSKQWKGMKCFNGLPKEHKADAQRILKADYGITPEDNGMVMFTSGTTGLPKGVLSTQRMVVSMIGIATFGTARAILRVGQKFPPDPVEGEPQSAYLIPSPIFHITGLNIIINCLMHGFKLVLIRRWRIDEAVKLIQKENVRYFAGVPSAVHDLVNSALPSLGHEFKGMTFGGSPLAAGPASRAFKAFSSAVIGQGYGATETNSSAITFSGMDFVTHPGSTGLPLPVTDVLVMKDGVRVAPNQIGEIWLKGPLIMKGYWGDEAATKKVITQDGWFKTGDLGYVDEENFVYVRDRIKDIIIRGGENVDSVAVENALYEEPGVYEAAAVGVPDERLGELVAAVVSIKPEFKGKVTEKSLLRSVQKLLPKFAIPVMIVIQEEQFEHNATGKIMKPPLRLLAQKEWERRSSLPKARM